MIIITSATKLEIGNVYGLGWARLMDAKGFQPEDPTAFKVIRTATRAEYLKCIEDHNGIAGDLDYYYEVQVD